MEAGEDGGTAISYGEEDAMATFRSMVESADRKFARVRDLPAFAPRGGAGYHQLLLHHHRKVFAAYTALWRFQQHRRADLVAAGLRRWEIGEIASRIGQLYYAQYLRTSEARFLLESYVFYEAILSRGYFEAKGMPLDLGLRYKELRFHARFLIVGMLLKRVEAVRQLANRFRDLVEESKRAFPDTNFKEWNQVLQEIVRFLKADASFTNSKTLRYNLLVDSHPSSLPYIVRFQAKAKRVLRLQDALLTSYRRNEVKFTELTLDTFRMLQNLEWEPSGSFYQVPIKEPSDNGALSDQGAASGLIDINLAADMTDPALPPNPHKAILYHPSAPHLISVLALICEDLSSDSILLVYISASGNADKTSRKWNNSFRQASIRNNSDASDIARGCLQLGSRGTEGLSNLFPEDLIPFTRRPLFLIVDSDSSHAFKALHGAERGEPAALLLSPEKASLQPSADPTSKGSQFTYFLTSPLLAFCELVGISQDIDADVYTAAETILSSALSEWEVMLCTSDRLDQVWAQVLPDPFLRRLLLRFIFCRAVFFLFHPPGESCQYQPECVPNLPEFVSPDYAALQAHVLRLAESLKVVKYFHFPDALTSSFDSR